MAFRAEMIKFGGLYIQEAAGTNGMWSNNVSAAGTTQATATPLTTSNNVVTTVALNSGVVWPAGDLGDNGIVVNFGANPLAVYPPVGWQIHGLGANAAYSVPVNKTLYIVQGPPTAAGLNQLFVQLSA